MFFMKNIGVKISIGALILLFIVLLAVIVMEFSVIKDKDEEIKNNIATISAKDNQIDELKDDAKSLKEEVEKMNSKLEPYIKPEEERKLEKIHPIEKEVADCMKKANYTASGIKACFNKANDKWEKKMQKHLSELSEALEEEEYPFVLASQKDWEEYRKSQIKMIKKIYSNTDRMIYPIYAFTDIVGITKDRARYLGWLLRISEYRK